jgi:FkbM family methyltransferase
MNAYAVKLRNGTSVHVPTSILVTSTYVLLEQETWFETEFDFVTRCVAPGDTAIDVGANFGVYATALAKAVAPAGRVIAFEPTARTARYLRSTAGAATDSRIDVHQAAVSDRAGTAWLTAGWTPELNALATGTESPPGGEQVPVVPLDDALRDCGGPISFLKIDAEGHELRVGQGGRTTLSNHEPLVMFEATHAGAINVELLAFLRDLGFSAYSLVPGLGVLAPLDPARALDNFRLNLFACTDRRAAQLRARGLLSLAAAPAEDTPAPSCLAHFAAAQSGASLEIRVGHLSRAYEAAVAATRQDGTVEDLLTLARVSRDIGERAKAAGVLLQALARLEAQPTWRPERAFLSPEALGTHQAGFVPDGFYLRLLEEFERLRSFSSRFVDQGGLPVLEQICRHPDCTREMLRRRQLARMGLNLQSAPEPDPRLMTPAADNLNAWFWRQTGRVQTTNPAS